MNTTETIAEITTEHTRTMMDVSQAATAYALKQCQVRTLSQQLEAARCDLKRLKEALRRAQGAHASVNPLAATSVRWEEG